MRARSARTYCVVWRTPGRTVSEPKTVTSTAAAFAESSTVISLMNESSSETVTVTVGLLSSGAEVHLSSSSSNSFSTSSMLLDEFTGLLLSGAMASVSAQGGVVTEVAVEGLAVVEVVEADVIDKDEEEGAVKVVLEDGVETEKL